MIVSLTKSAPTQRAFFHTLPESPLPSQKQAKLVLSKDRSSQKRPLHKGSFHAPFQNRRFYRKNKRSLFYLPKPVIVSLTKAPLHKWPFPAPFQNRCFHHKNKQSLFLPTKSCFIYPKLVLSNSPVLTKNAPTQRVFPRTLPESPLLSQKQAKLVLSAKACDCKPHKKRPYTKGLFPHPSRIAVSIVKISKACFICQSPRL